MDRFYEVQRENRIFAEIDRLKKREKELLTCIESLKKMPPKINYILVDEGGEEILTRPYFMDNATIGLIGTEYDNFLSKNKIEWDKEFYFTLNNKQIRVGPTTSPLCDAQYIQKLKAHRNDKTSRIYYFNKNTIGLTSEELDNFINYEINRLDKEIIYSENGLEYKINPASNKNYYIGYLNKLKKVRLTGKYFD